MAASGSGSALMRPTVSRRSRRHRPHAAAPPASHPAAFYEPDGLRRVADRLHPNGVFALWSDDPPDAEFLGRMEAVFASCEAHVVTFPNPLTDGESACTVYVAKVGPT